MTALTGDSTLVAMITPAIFMTATGSLIISTSNRMSRVADRLRDLNEHADSLSRGLTDLDFASDRLDYAIAQIGKLLWRSERLRRALTLLYVAMAMFVGASLTIAFHVLVGGSVMALPTALAITGVLLLLVASAQLSQEAHASLRANRHDVDFHQELRCRRQGKQGPSR